MTKVMENIKTWLFLLTGFREGAKRGRTVKNFTIRCFIIVYQKKLLNPIIIYHKKAKWNYKVTLNLTFIFGTPIDPECYASHHFDIYTKLNAIEQT